MLNHLDIPHIIPKSALRRAALHPRLLRLARNQPQEIGKARVCHQVRSLMPRCCYIQCEWLGRDRDSGCSPRVRILTTPNIYNHKVVKFDHFKIWVVQHLPRPNKLGGQTPRKAHFLHVRLPPTIANNLPGILASCQSLKLNDVNPRLRSLRTNPILKYSMLVVVPCQ